MSNPFTLVYDALWSMVEAHPQFLHDVKVGNRIKFNSDVSRDPMKDAIALGDLPEVVLISENGQANMYNTSSTSMITRSYAWLVSTGDFRLTKILSEVEWQIFCAMHGWPEKLASLQWAGKNFVKKASIVSTSSGYSDPERNRGIIGWSAVWRCDVDMYFNFTDLKAEVNL